MNIDKSSVTKILPTKGICQKAILHYAGSTGPLPLRIDLKRGNKQVVTEVELSCVNSNPKSYFQVLRTSTTVTTAQKNIASTGSIGVLIGEQYFKNGSTMSPELITSTSDVTVVTFIGGTAASVYAKVSYVPLA